MEFPPSTSSSKSQSHIHPLGVYCLAITWPPVTGQGVTVKSIFSRRDCSLGLLDLDERGDQVSLPLVTGAVTYNSLEMLATIFQEVKKANLQEDNEAYLQKGVKERNKRWRKKDSWKHPTWWFWISRNPAMFPCGPIPDSCLLVAGTTGDFEALVFLLSSFHICM